MVKDKIDQEVYIKNLMTTPRVVGLRTRTKRCRCKYCGGRLRLKQIVYNDTIEPRIEIFCDDCQRIEYGVEPEIYALAKYYVERMNCDFFPELDDSDSKDRMNVGKVCEIIFWAMNNLSLVDMEGFKYPVEMDKKMIGESIIYDLDDEDDDTLEEVSDLVRLREGELRG